MRRLHTICILIGLLVLGSNDLFAQKDVFARKAIIPVPAGQTEFGDMVAGVDLDGDGKLEIYAVNNDVNDVGAELVPHIYKYVQNGAAWDSVWSAALPIPLQNTWPALTYGDMDGDGKMEIIWGPVNNLNATTNPNPARIVVFEAVGGGSTAMGVPDGAGGYKPNAQWTITPNDNVNLRPFRWVLADLKGDGKKELVFTDRASSTTGYRFGIVSVNNIPDNGDTTGVVWNLEFSGKDSTLASGTIYDLAVIDSTVYLFHQAAAGTVTIVQYRNGSYTIAKRQAGVLPNGSWKSASVVDLDADGKKEIVIGSWAAGSPKVYLLQPDGDSLKSTIIATLPFGGATARIYGGASGDFDNDGKLDFVFGSRDATPDAGIARLRYLGGTITDPANYETSLIDQGASGTTTGGRWDIFGVANLDADPEQEIIYSQGYPLTGQPIVVLDRHSFDWIPISVARADTNGDYQPDMRGQIVTLIGVINSTNVQTTNFGYFMQDDSAGIQVFKSGGLLGSPTVAPGYRIAVTGTIDYYRGTTEIIPASYTDIIVLDTGRVVKSIPLTIAQLKANPEKYESRSITLPVVQPAGFTAAKWPASGASANLNIWDGRDSLVLRLDSDTQVPGSPFPTFPVRLSGIMTQFTSSSTVYNDGYQITPFFPSDFVPINAPPLSNIALVSPANGSELYVADAGQAFDFVWRKAVDFNNDALIYQFKPAAFAGAGSNHSGVDTVKTVTGATLLGYLGTNDSLAFRWTVQAKDPTNAIVTSTDTFSLMLRKFTPTPGWAAQTSGVTTSLRTVSAVSPMVAWAAGGAGTVLRTINGGQTWTSVGSSPITNAASVNNISAVSDQVAFLTNSPDSANIYRTTDGGQTWTRVFCDSVVASAFLDAVHMYDAQNGIALGDPANGKWFIIRTTDGGATWAHIANEPAQVATESGYINCLATVGTTHIWFGTNHNSIYRSTDGGTTWSFSPAPGLDCASVWFNDTQNGVAGFYDGTAAISSDGGATWTAAAGLPAGTGTLFGIAGFGTDFWLTRGTNVYHSTNRGTSWTAETTSPGGTLRHISFVKSGSYTAGWAGTSTGNIVAFSGTLTGVQQVPSEVPTAYALEQNYPNPFNPSTTIRYALPAKAFVTLRVYDVLGREVTTLVNEERPAGYSNVLWSATNHNGVQISSGVYFYRIEVRPSDGSNPFVSINKMVLLK